MVDGGTCFLLLLLLPPSGLVVVVFPPQTAHGIGTAPRGAKGKRKEEEEHAEKQQPLLLAFRAPGGEARWTTCRCCRRSRSPAQPNLALACLEGIPSTAPAATLPRGHPPPPRSLGTRRCCRLAGRFKARRQSSKKASWKQRLRLSPGTGESSSSSSSSRDVRASALPGARAYPTPRTRERQQRLLGWLPASSAAHNLPSWREAGRARQLDRQRRTSSSALHLGGGAVGGRCFTLALLRHPRARC